MNVKQRSTYGPAKGVEGGGYLADVLLFPQVHGLEHVNVWHAILLHGFLEAENVFILIQLISYELLRIYVKSRNKNVKLI